MVKYNHLFNLTTSWSTRMSVLLLESSHINRLKHYVNKLQQQEFNLDGEIIIKWFAINEDRIGNTDHCRRWETYNEQVTPIIVHISGNNWRQISIHGMLEFKCL